LSPAIVGGAARGGLYSRATDDLPAHVSRGSRYGDIDMGSLSPWHLLILGALLLLVFGGRGKISSIMGDAAKGIRAFRDGLKGDEAHADTAAATAKPLPQAEPEKDPIVR
jgi:sec-independent protein translocase protein TatA